MDKTNLIGADFFIRNRKRILKSLDKEAPIVLTAHGLVQKTRDDDTYPFKQESNFWYLTGTNEPDVILVIDKSDEYLILPKRDARIAVFSGQVDKSKLQKISGIRAIYDHDEGWKRLSRLLKKTNEIATLKPLPEYIPVYSVYANPAGRKMVKKIKSLRPGLKLVDLRKNLSELRVIKASEELLSIKRAIGHTAKILELVYNNFDDYLSENDIFADIIHYQVKNRLELAFMPIIANGQNATILHYQSYNSEINKKEITLLDLGFSYSNYCSDITRCHSINPNNRQKAVYGAVLAIQEYALGLLKPGILPKDYENAVAKFAGEKLGELGLIRSIEGKNVSKYYRHRTSHFLGIDVHDSGNYAEPLRSGMVLTVEPGIYIDEENIGIRIEDNVVITEKGIENLSKGLAKDLESFEFKASNV